MQHAVKNKSDPELSPRVEKLLEDIDTGKIKMTRYMLLEHRKTPSVAAAVKLYRHGEVSLGKAAEIAGVGLIEFKETLASYSHKRILTIVKKDIRKADELLRKD